MTQAALTVHRQIRQRVRAAPDRSAESFRVLGKALGYSPSVVAAAAPAQASFTRNTTRSSPPRSRRTKRVMVTKRRRRTITSPARPEFRGLVCAIVARVPKGRVVTYGQVALLAGRPRAARLVGWIAHAGPSTLPWQRVVNRFGGLASGYTGGRRGHRADLEREGVVIGEDGIVDLARYAWHPRAALRRRLLRPLPGGPRFR